MLTWILVTALVAAVVTAVGVPLFSSLASRSRLVVHANERSSHRRPTPSGAGIVVVLAVAICLAVLSFPLADTGLVWLATVVAATAVVGLIDDARTLSARWKMAALLVAAVALLPLGTLDVLSLPYLGMLHLGGFAIPLTLLWLVGFANAFNFMDGINGIASLVAMVVAVALAIASVRAGEWSSAALGAVLAGALVGFVPFNFPHARVFLGDAGSLPIGLLVGYLVVRAGADGGLAGFGAISGWIVLSPFLFDVCWTLLRRALRDARLTEAHREHLYQRLAVCWGSHSPVTLLYGALTLAALPVAWLYEGGTDAQRLTLLGAILAVGLLGAATVRWLERRSGTPGA